MRRAGTARFAECCRILNSGTFGAMTVVLQSVERLLRGELTRSEDLQAGRVEASASKLLAVTLVMGAVAGACVGIYPAIRNRPEGFLQMGASTLKVPLLYLLTLGVTFPSLYVFSALANSRLRMRETLRLLLIATAVNVTVLASLGPILAFFAVSTRSHAFMQVLTISTFGVSGLLGLGFLRRAVSHVFQEVAKETAGEPSAAQRMAAVASATQRARFIFTMWTVVYALVGSQMAWILRPFLGAPGLPFVIFRGTSRNFFAGALDALRWAFE